MSLCDYTLTILKTVKHNKLKFVSLLKDPFKFILFIYLFVFQEYHKDIMLLMTIGDTEPIKGCPQPARGLLRPVVSHMSYL